MTAPHIQCQPEADGLRQHTPTPWLIEFSDKSGRFTFLGKRGDGNVRSSDGYGSLFSFDVGVREDADAARFPRVSPEMAANARLIYEAVNSHAALRSRVEELTKALEPLANLYLLIDDLDASPDSDVFMQHDGTMIKFGDIRKARALSVPLEQSGRGK